MLKSIHPLARVFWITLVLGVIVYRLNKTEYPGPDAYKETYFQELNTADYSPCMFPVIFFKGGSYVLDETAKENLNVVANQLLGDPAINLDISGMQNEWEMEGISNLREKTIINFLSENFQISPARLHFSSSDEDHFESPRHSSHSQHGHSYHHKKHHKKKHCGCKGKKNHRSHGHSDSPCKSKKSENMAVYLTCRN